MKVRMKTEVWDYVDGVKRCLCKGSTYEAVEYTNYFRSNGIWINKSYCEIINEAEEILKGAEKLSAQLNKSEWAKMPKVKEGTVKEEQYVVTQDIWGIKKEDIEVCPGAPTRFIFDIEPGAGALYINSKNITKFIEQGIIAEKKSKAEELAGRIVEAYGCTPRPKSGSWEDVSKQLYDVVLKELEKVMK